MDCIFCKIVNKEIEAKIIYENEYTIAFLDIFPNSNGHSLIIPKKHFSDFQSTDELYLLEVVKTKKIVSNILSDKLNPKGFNYLSNQGSEAYQMVLHYHEHIIPKYTKEKGFIISVNKQENELENIEKIFLQLK